MRAGWHEKRVQRPAWSEKMRMIDTALADRIRAEMPKTGVTEVKMFGGICFMLDGNMAAGTYQGGLMVRVGKEGHDRALARGRAKPMMQGSKVMVGYVIVEPDGIATREALRSWLDLGLAYARTLPPKEKAKR